MSIVNDTPTVVLLLVASLVIGCIFGSFLNVVIWRVPNHISLVNPKRSFCPNCEAPIAWYDNIPIISWLVLGAKCRHCKEPIAVRYPIVEALGGLSFLAVTLGALFGAYSPWILPELYVFAAVSIVIAYIDLDHHLILNVVLLPTLIATLALLALASLGTNEWNRLGRAVCDSARRVLPIAFHHMERWHGRWRYQTCVHTWLDYGLARMVAIHHRGVRSLLYWRILKSCADYRQKSRYAWRHTVRTVHAARHMAWHIRRGSDRHTVLASDGTRLNQSPANLQHVIYKERA